MSLAAEDEEQGGRFHAMDPNVPMHFPSNRHRQPHSRSGAGFFQPYSSRSNPRASISQTLMGGGRPFDEEILAALMADFDRAATAGSIASGSEQQDLSYEALTNLEDVKLTAPPELLATIPLDMCLKGGQWEDKVHRTTASSHTKSLSCHRCTQIEARYMMYRFVCAVCFLDLCLEFLQWFDTKLMHADTESAAKCLYVLLSTASVYLAQKICGLSCFYTVNWMECMQACSICQSEYEPDEVIMILPCEHHFHKECAMEWLGKHSKKCPICKESIGG